MVDAGRLPFLQQGDQTLSTRAQHESVVQRRARMVRVVGLEAGELLRGLFVTPVRVEQVHESAAQLGRIDAALRLLAQVLHRVVGAVAGRELARVEDVDAGIVELQELLAAFLETRVTIQTGSGRGKLVIEFADLEDLERVYRRIATGAADVDASTL